MKLYWLVIKDVMRRKRRVLFAVMGVIIGTMTVVGIFTISRAGEARMYEQLEKYGPNLTVIPAINNVDVNLGDLGLGTLSVGDNYVPEATWIEVDVDAGNQTVSIPVAELEDNWNIHFKLETNDGGIDFMAYIFEGKAYVRANVCSPCRSVGFALDEDNQILICDRCATIFDAETGSGIEGACVDYPKAAVPYERVSGRIVIRITDLTAAYQETIAPG